MNRRSLLSVALVAAIAAPASLAAPAAAQPEIVGLIVRYAPDAAAANDVRRAARELDAAGASIVRRLESRKAAGVGALSRPRLDYARRLAVGADLVSANRRLAVDEAVQAREALLAMPGVAAV